MSDRIEKSITIRAPKSRVWRALTDHREFGAWFNVVLEGPFVAGQPTEGQITLPGYEHVRMRVKVVDIRPEQYFSFNWLPYAIDPEVDYSAEEPTLVEFVLEPLADAILLRVTESGFDHVPAHRRAEAFRMNERGWEAQLKNIARYVEGQS